MNPNHFFEERIVPKLNAINPPPLPSLRKGVVIYGAGELGILALNYFEACGIEVRGIIDQVKTGTFGSKKNCVPISSVEEASKRWLSMDVPVAVAIAKMPFQPIVDLLRGNGWKTILPFYEFTRDQSLCHPLSNGWRLGELEAKDMEGIRFACRNWADVTSLFHFEAYIAWHASLEEKLSTLHPIIENERYTIKPLLDFFRSRNYQFVDIGSHLGESIGRMSVSGVTFTEYILIEPDRKSLAILEKSVSTLIPTNSNVRIFENVVGSQTVTVKFADGFGYCSQIWKHGSEERSAIKLDDMDLTPDFIKAHTEGTEFDVIEGAEKTIRENHPSLALAVYHNKSSLTCGIPRLMAKLPDYSWFFRLHSYQGTGAFMYGLPSNTRRGHR